MLNKININRNSFTILMGVFALSLSTGCGVKVTGVQVNTLLDATGDEWLDMTTGITTGTFAVPTIQLPIEDPVNQTQYGTFGVTYTTCLTCKNGNSASVNVNIDLTKLPHVQTSPALLPNGSALPVGGLGSAQVIAIPVSNTGVMIYFASGPSVAMLGVAVPFQQLAVVGTSIPGANVFPAFSFNTPVGPLAILAGIFSGSQPNTTGVGLFADLSVVVPHSPTLAMLTGTPYEGTVREGEYYHSSYRSGLRMRPVMPSVQTQMKLQKALNQVKNRQLTLGQVNR